MGAGLAAVFVLGSCSGNGGGDTAAASGIVSVTQAFPNLTFSEPVDMMLPPGDDSRWFLL